MKWYSYEQWLTWCQGLGHARNGGKPETCVFRADPHVLGVIGELIYAMHAGLQPDTNLDGPDGGTDFPGRDIKTTRHWREPFLRFKPTDVHKPWDISVLVAVNEARMIGRVVGWIRKSDWPRGEHTNFGFGPVVVFKAHQLNTGIDPCMEAGYGQEEERTEEPGS